jgi:hypothetical protein
MTNFNDREHNSDCLLKSFDPISLEELNEKVETGFHNASWKNQPFKYEGDSFLFISSAAFPIDACLNRRK